METLFFVVVVVVVSFYARVLAPQDTASAAASTARPYKKAIVDDAGQEKRIVELGKKEQEQEGEAIAIPTLSRARPGGGGDCDKEAEAEVEKEEGQEEEEEEDGGVFHVLVKDAEGTKALRVPMRSVDTVADLRSTSRTTGRCPCRGRCCSAPPPRTRRSSRTASA